MRRAICVSLNILMMLACVIIPGTSSAMAQQGVTLEAVYTNVAVPVDAQEVEISIRLTNTGASAREVQLSASGPEGWKTYFESGYPKKIVRGLYLPASSGDDPDHQQELTFKVIPPDDADLGDYLFQLSAAGPDGPVYDSLDLTVGLIASDEVVSGEVTLSADSTILEKESSQSFKFGVQLKNEGTEDRWFDFFIEQPESGTPALPSTGWGTSVTEGYGGDRIKNILVKAGQSKQLQVTLEPIIPMAPGEYSLYFGAMSDASKSDSILLTAKIIGTYEIDIRPPDEDPRLNFSATAGKTKHITIVVENKGSSTLTNISFHSYRTPSEWNVTFTPNTIESLERNQSQKIDVAVEPSGNAIAGDYLLEIEADAYNTSDTVEYRVKVNTSSAWGWIGIVIVIVVVFALLGVFYKLRRR